jgi:hypothetical protein
VGSRGTCNALLVCGCNAALGGLAVHPRILKTIPQYQSITEIAADECPVSVPSAGLAHSHRHKHAPPHRRLDGRAPAGASSRPMGAATSATASTAVPTNPEPDAELAAVKARARRAYLDARRKGAAPPALCDRLHADTLLALDGAPPRAAHSQA